MKRFLIVVDMQKDFVDGALGTREAVAAVPAAVKKIRDFDGKIFVTYDTHGEDYLRTAEGKNSLFRTVSGERKAGSLTKASPLRCGTRNTPQWKRLPLGLWTCRA